MTAADLTLFGPFALKLADGRVADLPGQKDRALLAILALSAGTAQSREKLASLLWSDRGDAQARDSLKHALTRIRQCLGEALIADRQTAQLDPSAVASDVTRLERLVRDGTPKALEQACALCVGDLLDGISIRDAGFEEWLLAERQRLRRLHEDALTKLLAPSLPIATRERAARQLLALDPLREVASRALMQIHGERGETAQAIKLFESLRDRLHVELGVKPQPETAKLYDQLRQGRPVPDANATPALLEPALPSKPSIAVLPFQNLSGDAEQEYFADGMVEEIITALSRVPWLFVIARNSSFTYRDRAVDVKQIGRELGVRYVVEGSVRKAANRVRITAQLIDAINGAHLWADRFDGTLEEVFDLQDQVAASVVGAISPKLEQAEIERAARKPTESLDAYDHFLRGMACVHQWTRKANLQALEHFRRAIELDPGYAAAYGMAARCYSQRKVSGWVTDRERDIAEAAGYAWRAVQIGKNDPVALSTAGVALAYVVGDLDNGDAMIERALAINPNWAWSWLFSGWAKNWLGESELALDRTHRAMRMSPQDPQFFNMQTGAAWAHFTAGRYADSATWARAALRGQPDYVTALRLLAASSALLGDLEEARSVMARLRELDPDARVSTIRQRDPLRRPEHLARLAEGLRLAGLPE
ncbi:MAG TPA: BTAD domain-containing putative transcriptional regulator [Dongiaceae bacterium]|jgi:TolB-like protein/Tfp pilus assembly protein PilF